MVRKVHKSGGESASGTGALSGAVRDSAQQIWLAGLGAFSKAQEEGGKVFETLVKEGMALQRKTQAAAEEKISEATNRVTSMATDITSKATGQWDKLEGIFEERVFPVLTPLAVDPPHPLPLSTKQAETGQDDGKWPSQGEDCYRCEYYPLVGGKMGKKRRISYDKT